MNHDARDVMSIGEPHLHPGFAAVAGFINSITPRGALPIVALAGADPNYVGFRLRYRHVADARHSLVVEHRLPGDSAVDGFPNSTARQASVDDIGVAFDHREIVDASAHVRRTDLAKLERFEG